MAYKIVDADKLDAKLHDLADKIRAKNGTTEGLDFFDGDFSEAVDNIEKPKEEQEKTLTVTENGAYEAIPDAEKVFSKVNVDVAVPLRYDEGYSDGYEASQNSITLQEKTVTENGEVTADEGYTGLSKVDVNVPERKEEQEKTLSVTKNGSYSVLPDENKVLSGVEVEVDVIDNRVTEIETAIDESGVLDSTEGTVTEKVEQVIDKAEQLTDKDILEEMYYKESYYLTINNTNSPFYYSDWTYPTIPKIDFSRQASLVYAFASPHLEYFEHYINSSNCLNFSSAFAIRNIKRIKGVDTSNATNVREMFGAGLEEIEEPLNLSKVTALSNIYSFCQSFVLREIRFVPETIKISISLISPVLTEESIQSIIDGLATAETTQTLYLNSQKVANLTDEQLRTIANKNWTVG